MNILFLCKANLFRSRMAHEFFEMYNKNNNHIVDSAALIYDFKTPHKLVINAMKEINVDISNKNPKKVNQDLIDWADLIVLMFPDLEEPLKKFEVADKIIEIWEIEDIVTSSNDDDRLSEFIKSRIIIEKKVKDFIQNLNKNL